MFRFKEQFEKVKRFLKRIENQNRDQTDYEDDLWVFFQNAWHLKDWIINDEILKKNKNLNIKQFIKEKIEDKPNIQLCRDFANGTKHLKLDVRKDSESGIYVAKNETFPEVICKDVTIKLQGPVNENLSVEHEYNYRFKDKNNREYNALDLARNIVSDWQEIIDAIEHK